MNIPLHLLHTLVTFSTEKTVEATAIRLQTTQPTISRQLQQLQDHVKHPLFEHSGRQKKLTPYGRLLAQKLEQRFDNIDILVHEANLEQGLSENILLHFGGRMEILKRWVGHKKFPVQVHLEPMGSLEIEKRILNNQLDLAITQDELSSHQYIKKVLFSDEWRLIVPRTFLKNHKNIEAWIPDSHLFPYCCYKPQMTFVLNALKNEHFSTPSEAFIFPDWITLEERVHSGLNWTVLPTSFVRKNRDYNTHRLMHIDPQVFYLYYRKSLSRFEWFRELAKSILNY